MVRITKQNVDALASDGKAPLFLWDDLLAGFGVKALPSGPKRFVVKYRTRGGGRSAPQRWITLGTHGQLTPDQARKMAQQVLAAVARGEDPQAEKQMRRDALTLNALWQRFQSDHLSHKKQHTQYDYRNLWAGVLAPKFGAIRVEALSRSEVDQFHKAMGNTPYQANRALALLSIMMTKAELWHLRAEGTNPCNSVSRFPEKSRTRFLTVPEIESVAKAIDSLVAEKEISKTAAYAIELLLLTGARPC